jgi:uncharacterized protein YebE (UPF0316 family)
VDSFLGGDERMGVGFDLMTLLTGVLIFLARIADVSLGTVRTISIVHGRTKFAFFLGFLEVSLWLVVITTVIGKITDKPVLGIFYALGFASGNAVGIMIERRIAFGNIVLRVISTDHGRDIAEKIRKMGYGVTTFQGEGMTGPVIELYIVCRRRNLREIIPAVKAIEPDAFYITEQAGSVSKIYRPFMTHPTGWRAIFKRK